MFRKIIYRIILKRIRPFLRAVLFRRSRINEEIADRYWYPLASATYDESEIMEALDSMASFKTSMFEKTNLFEENFSKYQSCKESIMVNSGSSADLLLSYLLTNPLNPILNKGDEVLVASVTWPTQIWSIMMAGLIPKFVDVDPSTLNIDIKDLENKISDKSKAIFLVHLLGNPCNIDEILRIVKENKLILLEDCAEALGAEWEGIKVGNFGVGAAFSFFFSHHMTTMEGGMVCLNNKSYADHLRVMRSHGWLRNIKTDIFKNDSENILDSRYEFHNWGFNMRPTEVQSAFGLKQLEKLKSFNIRREEISKEIFSFLSRYDYFQTIEVHKKAKPSWLGIPIVLRDDTPFELSELTEYLESSGIETRPILTGNILRQPVSKKLFPHVSQKDFPGAEILHSRGLYIGLSPITDGKTIERLKDTIKIFLDKH